MSKSEDKGADAPKPVKVKTRKVLLSVPDAALLRLMLDEYEEILTRELRKKTSTKKTKECAEVNIKIINDLKQKIFGL